MLLTGRVGRVAQRSVLCDEPFVIVLGMLAVCASERICHCFEAIVKEGLCELLVVKASRQRVLDRMRRSNDFDLDAEIESRHGKMSRVHYLPSEI